MGLMTENVVAVAATATGGAAHVGAVVDDYADLQLCFVIDRSSWEYCDR
jgi:hypothetical protein